MIVSKVKNDANKYEFALFLAASVPKKNVWKGTSTTEKESQVNDYPVLQYFPFLCYHVIK